MRKKLFIIIILSMIYCIDARMPLYAIFTPSHNVLFEEYFSPSIQDDFDLHIKHIEQECSSAVFMSQDWTKTTRKKVAYIIQAIEENMGDIFIFSDVDIQFFGSIEGDVRVLMQDKDFLVQKDHPKGIMCSGFFVCRANEKTKAMWQDALCMMETDHKVSDQTALNRCLTPTKGKINPYDIVWEYLPGRYFGGGTFTGRHWTFGKRIPVPHDAKMHHANWTKGIKNKIDQLKYVKMVIKNRSK